jgi:DNA-binding NtrC family response regulator
MIRVALYSLDSSLQSILAPALGRDFQVIASPSGERVKNLVFDGAVDVLLLDLDTNEYRTEEQVRFFDDIRTSGVAVIVLTDDEARVTAVELMQKGAHSYCRKPPVLRELKGLIQRAGEHTVMRRKLESMRDPAPEHNPALEAAAPDKPWCDSLIGGSPSMRGVYDLVRRVADLNTSVLITGASGTGKELIARAIHNTGNRANLPFVAVSCGAIPETLIESELFGHEKGAFTGTNGTRTGYFEQAGGGTLFLDEIGELSLQTQVKLLRVLQQREFTRLGSSRPIPLKARVIFATHRDLSRMVEERMFRLDLYYRINVMNIKAPALTDHPEDIPLLAEHFIRQYSELSHKRVSGISVSALAMLTEYDWPGNVRELENVIQGAIIRADGETIVPSDLPEQFHERSACELEDCPQVGTFERLLRDYKLKLALKAIEDCHGNKTLAAKSLDISRAYLHRLIRGEGVQAIDAA